MVRINNTDLMNELRDVAKIQVGSDMIPNVMGNQVIPVVDVNPKHARRITDIKSTSAAGGTTTIFTTHATKDTLLWGFTLSRIKIATDTGTLSKLVCYINGGAKNLIIMEGVTLTAQENHVSLFFECPILLDRGSNVFMESLNQSRHASSIFITEIDNPNA